MEQRFISLTNVRHLVVGGRKNFFILFRRVELAFTVTQKPNLESNRASGIWDGRFTMNRTWSPNDQPRIA